MALGHSANGWRRRGAVGVGVGTKRGRHARARRTLANFVKNFNVWALAQPWSLGAVRSMPSLESSLRAISRRRPSARKMRRRLTALAGATDKRIRGDIHVAAIKTSNNTTSEILN